MDILILWILQKSDIRLTLVSTLPSGFSLWERIPKCFGSKQERKHLKERTMLKIVALQNLTLKNHHENIIIWKIILFLGACCSWFLSCSYPLKLWEKVWGIKHVPNWVFFGPLEMYWKLDIWSGIASPIWRFKT